MAARDFTPMPHRRLRQARFLAELAGDGRVRAAAAAARLSVKTLYAWRRRNPAFRRAWERAREFARHPPFPAAPELAAALDGTALLLPGESRSLVLPQPGRAMWIEEITRRRDDGTIETARREIEPSPAQRAEFEARYAAWAAERGKR